MQNCIEVIDGPFGMSMLGFVVSDSGPMQTPVEPYNSHKTN
jgi:hypothetical protein